MSLKYHPIDKVYIEKIPYLNYRDMQPVHSKSFFDALAGAYGTEDVAKAVIGLLDQSNDSNGVRDFQQRLEKAFDEPTVWIHPDDQKYLTYIVHMVSIKRLF